MDFKKLELDLAKNWLRKEKIKLWLPPYIGDDGKNAIEDLARRASKQLKVSLAIALNCFETLQHKSIENLKDREEYQSSGIACVKVQQGSNSRSLKINLNCCGKELKYMVATAFNIPASRIKLICKGKVIKDEDSLEGQAIDHGALIMCLVLSESAKDLAEFEKSNQVLDETKRDVDILAGRVNPNGESYLQITDQSGKALNIPAKEQKALVMAMTLHEKGRTALKQMKFDHALVLLLEAEKGFSECNSKLLEQVDNYGLLNLDIAWCYLNLQSLQQLPDAEARLNKCQQVFNKSYGVNRERLMSLKGTSGNERALFLRLDLLQAIVMFHKGNFEEARPIFGKVEAELKELKVDDEKLSQLVSLGYDEGEARMGLRETRGDLEMAVSVIEAKKAERKKVREAEKKKREQKKEKKRLGKCLDGNWVEPEFHKALLAMGYSNFTAKWALAQTNNRISDAVTLIQDHPERIPFNHEAVDQITTLGFGLVETEAALARTSGDLAKAVQELTAAIVGSEPGTSSSSRPVLTPEEEKEAYDRVAEDIAVQDDDYLDLILTAEENFLMHYSNLLQVKLSSHTSPN